MRSGVEKAAALLASLALLATCGEAPQEEIVIRAGDEAPAGGTPSADTLAPVQPPPDSAGTVALLPADTLALPDSLFMAVDSTIPPVDSLPAVDGSPAPEGADTTVVPEEVLPGECPWERLAIEVNGSLYGSLEGHCDEPEILGAHICRCLCWDMDPWRSMNAGDSVYVLHAEGATGRENRVVALRYVPREGTAGEELSMYSFLRAGDNYESFWYAGGLEVMELLDYMPITTFEEMTSPYGEPRGRRDHAGVDFKAPAGTPVRTCRGGTVGRVDWNTDYNGHCVEVDIDGGYSEIFLHLESVAPGIAPGTTVEQGQTVGYVGNTGRTSTAPHLHYQINDESERTIDPYVFYGSYRRSLTGADMEEFEELVRACDHWLSGGGGSGGE